MKIQCRRCLPKHGIEIPDFTFSEKQRLLEQHMTAPIQAINYLKSLWNMELSAAKYTILHLNTYGQCHHCSFIPLEEENINCPQCGAFNFNWKEATE